MKFPKDHDYFFLRIVVIILSSISCQAQQLSFQKLLDTTNLFYGSSPLLNLGTLYHPENARAKGHPYFVTDDYTPASLSVSNTLFENIKARYNIATDQLIIKAALDSGVLVSMVTKEDFINSFTINSHTFVNMTKLYPRSTVVKGYCEEVFNGKHGFFIKYKKEFVRNFDFDNPNGFYSTVKTENYFYNNGEFMLIKSRRDFLKLFQNKRDIKKYMRDNKIKFSKASPAQLNKLMQFCDESSLSN